MSPRVTILGGLVAGVAVAVLAIGSIVALAPEPVPSPTPAPTFVPTATPAPTRPPATPSPSTTVEPSEEPSPLSSPVGGEGALPGEDGAIAARTSDQS